MKGRLRVPGCLEDAGVLTSIGRSSLRVLAVMGFFIVAASPLRALGGAQDLDLHWSYHSQGEGGSFRLYRALGSSELTLIAEFPAEAGRNRVHYSDPGTRQLPGVYQLRFVDPSGREVLLATARWEPSRLQPIPAPLPDRSQRSALPSREQATFVRGSGMPIRLEVVGSRKKPARPPSVPPPEVSSWSAIDLGP